MPARRGGNPGAETAYEGGDPVGINRWIFRVLAYVGLMRDEYPPFRLRP